MIVVEDCDAVVDRYPRTRELAAAIGWRSGLFVPLLRDGAAIGALGIVRAAQRRFDEKEVALAQTFADQAVIAIENARLFNETKEALERQTASAEVLQVISESVADTRPVFDSISRACSGCCPARAGGCCDAAGARLLHWRRTAARLRDVLRRSSRAGAEASASARCARRRAALDRAHGPDAPRGCATRCAALDFGNCSMLFVPLRCGRRRHRCAVVVRFRRRPLATTRSRCSRTFADQAVIAIQNARLFNETQEALEQQTATAEVLQVISSSVADVQPVFDIIAERARGCPAREQARSFGFDGEQLHIASTYGIMRGGAAAARPRLPDAAARRLDHRAGRRATAA